MRKREPKRGKKVENRYNRKGKVKPKTQLMHVSKPGLLMAVLKGSEM